MNILYFIAFMLVLIFVVLAWRFILPVLAVAFSILLWVLLFRFVKGLFDGARERTHNDKP